MQVQLSIQQQGVIEQRKLSAREREGQGKDEVIVTSASGEFVAQMKHLESCPRPRNSHILARLSQLLQSPLAERGQCSDVTISTLFLVGFSRI